MLKLRLKRINKISKSLSYGSDFFERQNMSDKISCILLIVLWMFGVRFFIYRNSQRDLNNKRFSVPKPIYFLMFPYLRRKFNIESNFQVTVFELIFFIFICIPNIILYIISMILLILNIPLYGQIMRYDVVYVTVASLIMYIFKDIFDSKK